MDLALPQSGTAGTAGRNNAISILRLRAAAFIRVPNEKDEWG
jgi:hypothetical protein